jgi:preprotein translocase subunit SecG
MGILYSILVALLVLDGLVLALVVLMQAGKGGGLAAMGGGGAATEGILAGRQAATVFTRASWICGGAFMFLALVLSIMSSRAQQPASILEQDFRQQAPAGTPQPVVPGGAAGATGAAPAETPTEPTPPAGR